MKITCVGAGPAGLYLSILAAKDGHEVTVLERHDESTVHGWGVVFWDDLLDALRAADPESAEEIVAGAFAWIDQLVLTPGRPAERVGGGGYGIGRRLMRDVLLRRARALGVEVRFEHPVDDPASLAGADLVVAADGVNSTVRDASADALGTALERGRNKYVWLGTDRVFEIFTFPTVRTPAGWIWAHAYAYDSSTSTFIVETTPETWRRLGLEGLGTEETMRRLEELFATYLDGHALRPQPGTGAVMPWLEFQRVTNERWHVGNVVLVGDAAHTTHFTIGSGTRLALEDAIALASELRGAGDLQAALGAYGERRAAELREAQREAENSARWFEQLPRYAEYQDGRWLAHLLSCRRSSFLARMPLPVYVQASHAADRMPMLARPAKAVVRRVRRLLQGASPS